MSRKWFYQLLVILSARGREDYFSKKSFLFSIVLLIFALGTYLGKQFSDTQYQSRLVQLSNCQNNIVPEKSEPDVAEIRRVDPLQGISSHEVRQTIKPETAEVDAKVQDKMAEAPKAVVMKSEVVAPEAAKPKNRVPSAIPPAQKELVEKIDYVGIDTPLTGVYTIQVLATKKLDEAESYIKKLAVIGVSAYYMKITSDPAKAPMYRVCVGQFDKKKHAEMYFYENIDKKDPSIQFFVRNIVK